MPMHATTTEEFFNQAEYYFSASQGKALQIEGMALPYIRNCLVKLMREYGQQFAGTPLFYAMLARIMPSSRNLEKVLRATGEASHYVGAGIHDVRNARNKFYRAGKRMGRQVTTHKDGDWVRGTCDPDVVNIRVRR